MCAKWDFVCLHEPRIYVKTWSQMVQLLCAVSLSWNSHNLRHNVRRSLRLYETSSSQCMLMSRDIWHFLCRGKNLYYLLWYSVTHRLPRFFYRLLSVLRINVISTSTKLTNSITKCSPKFTTLQFHIFILSDWQIFLLSCGSISNRLPQASLWLF